MSPKLAATLQEWVAEFMLDLKRRNYSSLTTKVYRCDLLLFAAWVGEQPNLRGPGDLTPELLEQYQMHLMLRSSRCPRKSHPRTMTAGSRNRHLAELRSFFRFLKKSCRLLGNPSLELERARQTKRLPKNILSVPEVFRLLGEIPDTPIGLRDQAAVEVLYGAGVRRGELLGLSLPDLRLGEGLAHVLGKGNKDRVVPLGQAAVAALEAYLLRGRPQLLKGSTQALLISSRGGPVSDQELLSSLRVHAKRTGIKKVLGFHLFRHTCATHLLRGGADLRSIQTLLGHADLNTTAIYTRVDVSNLQETVRKYHPREQDPDHETP